MRTYTVRLSKRGYLGKDGVAFSSKKMDWETEPELYRILHKEFDFGLDAAATEENKLCANYINPEENALTKDWSQLTKKAIFCNPPYGRTLLKWAKKFIKAAKKNIVVALVPARTCTKFFKLLSEHGTIRLLTGRVKFYNDGEPVAPAPFPSMVWIGGPAQKVGKHHIVTGRIEVWDWRNAA